MRVQLVLLAAAALLAACAPVPPPPSYPPGSTFGGPVPIGTGVGFDTDAERARRDAALTGEVPATDLLRGGPVNAQPLPPSIIEPAPTGAQPLPGGGLDPSVIDAVEGAVNPARPLGPISALPPTNAPVISDEQSFEAVAQRQTIASDAERLAQNRAQYVQIAPRPLPVRPAAAGPNIVSYAVSTTNAVGQPVYRRSGIFGASRLERACGRYSSPDAAQAAFLEKGGPERDGLGLDPDGDGFACGWNPAPFRRAASS